MHKLISYFVLCILFFSLPVHSWEGSRNLEPNLNPDDVLFFEDFENSKYIDHWNTFWNEPFGAGLISKPSSNVYSGNQSAFTNNITENIKLLVPGSMCL